MATSVQTKDEMLTSLALPLRSVSANQTLRHTETMGEGKTFGGGTLSSDPKCKRPALECSFIDLGHTTILSGRTTPVHAREHGTGSRFAIQGHLNTKTGKQQSEFTQATSWPYHAMADA